MSTTDFQTVKAEALSVGASAQVLSPPKVRETGGMGTTIRGARLVRITNTHASQTLYYGKTTAPTSTVNDGIILAGKSAIFALPANANAVPQILGSGGSTTGVAEYGG